MVVRAFPSVEEQKKMAKEELSRVEEQRNALGTDGLAKKAEELNHAMATNEIPPPSEMLTQIPIPDVTNIKSLPSTLLERCTDGKSANKLGDLDLNQFPTQVTACDIATTFGYVIIFVSHKISHKLIEQYISCS